MRPYFEEMTPLGKELTDKQRGDAKENIEQIKAVEEEIAEAIEAVKNAGIPAEIIKKRGQLTVWERIEYLIDPGTWVPLHTLLNPQFNEEGTTGVIDGLAKIGGKWAMIIGFDNKVMAGDPRPSHDLIVKADDHRPFATDLSQTVDHAGGPFLVELRI